MTRPGFNQRNKSKQVTKEVFSQAMDRMKVYIENPTSAETPWFARSSMNHRGKIQKMLQAERWKNSLGRPKGSKDYKKRDQKKTALSETQYLTLMSELTNKDMDKIMSHIESYRPKDVTPENTNRDIAVRHKQYMVVNYNSASKNRQVSQSLYELVMQGMKVSFSNPANTADKEPQEKTHFKLSVFQVN